MSPTRVRFWFYGCFLCGTVAYVAYTTWMPGTSFTGERPNPTPTQRELLPRLRKHVETLASVIGPRNVDRPIQLGAAREYIFAALADSAGAPGMLRLEELGAAGQGAQNVIFDVPGRKSPSIVVVGAHYDSCDESPGANDNATGVAAALELARAFAQRPAESQVRFVLFANEEPPFFQRPGMGSRTHARNAHEAEEPVTAMLSLETIGYYSDAEGSQRYPWPIGLLYPSTGNFVAFVGDLGSGALVRRSIATFRKAAPFPSEGAALPSTFPGVDWSDHWSFRQEGFPAIMVTDTAVYRDPSYHKPTDTAERLDYAALAHVTVGLEAVVRELAR